MPDERVTRRNALAGDDLQDTWRDHLLRQLGEAEKRQRRLLGRLHDLDVSRRERRPDLPHRHVQRVVPGADARDDAERLAADHRGISLDVLPGRLAFEIPRRPGEEAEVVRHSRRLVLGDPPGLPDVLRLEARELLGVLVNDVREGEKELHPVLRRLRLPLTPRLLGGIDGLLDVLARPTRHFGDDLASRGVQDLHRLTARRLHPLAADELLHLGHRNAHSRPPLADSRMSVSRRPATWGQTSRV